MTDFPRTMTRAERSAALAALVREHEERRRAAPIRIEVTADDIREGRRGEPCRCAIAIAAERTLGYPVSVGLTKIERKGTWEAAGLLPDEVSAWIDRFDRGHKVEPMAFELIPLEEPCETSHLSASFAS